MVDRHQPENRKPTNGKLCSVRNADPITAVGMLIRSGKPPWPPAWTPPWPPPAFWLNPPNPKLPNNGKPCGLHTQTSVCAFQLCVFFMKNERKIFNYILEKLFNKSKHLNLTKQTIAMKKAMILLKNMLLLLKWTVSTKITNKNRVVNCENCFEIV